MVTISAIISAYFLPEFMQSRIDNLLEQDPQPEIIICARRGSKEARIAKRYKFPLIETDDVPTIYAAWNLCIHRATGDYIVPANCDDSFVPGGLKMLSEALDNNPDCAVSYGEVYRITEDNKVPRIWHRGRNGGVRELLLSMFVGPFPMWRRSLHEKYGWFDETLHNAGDYDWFLRLAHGGEKFYQIPKPAGIYYARKNSLEHRNPEYIRDETLMLKQKYGKLIS